MRALAWTLIAIHFFNLIMEPFLYGKPREPYGKMTWIAGILGLGLYIPILGRVLGWW